jgi:cell division protein FtsI (penicillin-binding protein 3)
MVDANAPMKWGKFKPSRNSRTITITGRKTVGDGCDRGVLVERRHGHLALLIGGERQRPFLKSRIGPFWSPSPVELVEAPGAKPACAQALARYRDDDRISYGHGLSASPLHLAAAYAAMANGGQGDADPFAPLRRRKGERHGVPATVGQRRVMMLRRVVTAAPPRWPR